MQSTKERKNMEDRKNNNLVLWLRRNIDTDTLGHFLIGSYQPQCGLPWFVTLKEFYFSGRKKTRCQPWKSVGQHGKQITTVADVFYATSCLHSAFYNTTTCTGSRVSSIVISPTWSIPAAAGQKEPVPEEWQTSVWPLSRPQMEPQ